MTPPVAETSGPSAQTRTAVVAAIVAALVIAVGTLLWSKWLPYQARVRELSAGHTWSGSSILRAGGVQAGDPPSWSAATTFTWAYLQAVWKALVAALLISAAVQALIPRGWLLRVLNRRSRTAGALAGGLAATPSMMCACCSAPVAVSLRRSGVSTSAVVAYWLGNPLLNPAVLIFLALVAPWQWSVTRLVVGGLVVVGGAALVARLTDKPAPDAVVGELDTDTEPRTPGRLLRDYGRVLLRLAVTLVPEYLVVVLLIGAFRGWLLPLSGDPAGPVVLVVLVAAVLGTLMVIPTGGEIPILQGLALAGLSLGPIGALLVTLPAVSLPGLAMVIRSFGPRVTAATTGVVVAGGMLGAALLAVL
jgi:uncharacterized membrane protein YraQ (UPF0718 family)